MRNLILIGAGGHCRSCIDVIEQEKKYNIIGLIDLKEKIGENVLGYKIIDSDDNINKYVTPENSFLITIGQIHSPVKRIELYDMLKNLKANLATIISPLAYVSKHAIIGEGTIIMHHALVNANARIGNNCIVNSKALIEHDAVIKDNCHISTSAVINGGTVIENNTFVGSNSVVVQYTNIHQNSFIKAQKLAKPEKNIK